MFSLTILIFLNATSKVMTSLGPVTLIREINWISRNQLSFAKSTYKIKNLWQMYIELFSSKKVNELMGGTLSQNNKF